MKLQRPKAYKSLTAEVIIFLPLERASSNYGDAKSILPAAFTLSPSLELMSKSISLASPDLTSIRIFSDAKSP
jgi:hypothetical protein